MSNQFLSKLPRGYLNAGVAKQLNTKNHFSLHITFLMRCKNVSESNQEFGNTDVFLHVWRIHSCHSASLSDFPFFFCVWSIYLEWSGGCLYVFYVLKLSSLTAGMSRETRKWDLKPVFCTLCKLSVNIYSIVISVSIPTALYLGATAY